MIKFLPKAKRFTKLLALTAVISFCISASTNLITEYNNSVHYHQNEINKNWNKCCRFTNKATLSNICGDNDCHGICPSNYSQMMIEDSKYDGRMEKAFFIESSGALSLNSRQACSIESFARLHPNITIYVLLTSDKQEMMNTEMELLQENYRNVVFFKLDLDDYIAGSPLEKWYYCNKDWRQDPRRADHLSDGLRLLTLYNYGGYYFDMDFVFFRSVPNYKRFLVSQSSTSFTNSAMHYNSAQSTLFKMALTEFTQNFKADKFGFNGPHLINRVFQKWCSHENVTLMRPDGYQIHFSQNDASCEGVQILPEDLFHPPATHYSPKWKENTLHQLPLIDSYGSKTIAVRLFSDVYKTPLPPQNHNARLAERFCPITFSLAPSNSF